MDAVWWTMALYVPVVCALFIPIWVVVAHKTENEFAQSVFALIVFCSPIVPMDILIIIQHTSVAHYIVCGIMCFLELVSLVSGAYTLYDDDGLADWILGITLFIALVLMIVGLVV